jgi:hypothetical protein
MSQKEKLQFSIFTNLSDKSYVGSLKCLGELTNSSSALITTLSLSLSLSQEQLFVSQKKKKKRQIELELGIQKLELFEK